MSDLLQTFKKPVEQWKFSSAFLPLYESANRNFLVSTEYYLNDTKYYSVLKLPLV